MSKIFIVGLPRTGTTSLCVTLMALGFKVAHTAFSKACIQATDAAGDAPIFVDYPHLDQCFPGSKFIYLDRPISDWLPSIKGLLQKVTPELLSPHTGRSPILRRSYESVFGDLTVSTLYDYEHLQSCYMCHQRQVSDYFQGRSRDLLTLCLDASEGEQQFPLTTLAPRQPGLEGKTFVSWLLEVSQERDHEEKSFNARHAKRLQI